jgi:hypothetical protein
VLVVAVDGTTIAARDSPANAAAFKASLHLPVVAELPDGSFLAHVSDPRAVEARTRRNRPVLADAGYSVAEIGRLETNGVVVPLSALPARS